MAERSVAESEVIQAISEGPWRPARSGRQRASKWYPFRQTYRGTCHMGQDVQPIFVDEPNRIVVVTVLVYLNQREGPL